MIRLFNWFRRSSLERGLDRVSRRVKPIGDHQHTRRVPVDDLGRADLVEQLAVGQDARRQLAGLVHRNRAGHPDGEPRRQRGAFLRSVSNEVVGDAGHELLDHRVQCWDQDRAHDHDRAHTELGRAISRRNPFQQPLAKLDTRRWERRPPRRLPTAV